MKKLWIHLLLTAPILTGVLSFHGTSMEKKDDKSQQITASSRIGIMSPFMYIPKECEKKTVEAPFSTDTITFDRLNNGSKTISECSWLSSKQNKKHKLTLTSEQNDVNKGAISQFSYAFPEFKQGGCGSAYIESNDNMPFPYTDFSFEGEKAGEISGTIVTIKPTEGKIQRIVNLILPEDTVLFDISGVFTIDIATGSTDINFSFNEKTLCGFLKKENLKNGTDYIFSGKLLSKTTKSCPTIKLNTTTEGNILRSIKYSTNLPDWFPAIMSLILTPPSL